MSSRRLCIYGNWSAYDELSDGVPLTEELAMRQLAELVRLRSYGVRFDAYLMDAFWFAEDGGYRTWRTPNWPNGPDAWLSACKENDLIPGLWFTANTLCHIRPADAWHDSADENKWGLCCFHGGFLSDYLEVLGHWYRQGIRIFKLDFADFTAAPPHLKATLTPEEIRTRNIEALRTGLKVFRQSHPEALFMAFNGFEEKEYMDRTDRSLEPVLDLGWLEVFDSIYSGDPRPSDVPAIPFWRSVDIYSDHTARVLEHAGIPLDRIDNCGFMAGPTGTCYWRGKANWKSMLLLTLARGGDLTVLYGDLSQFSDEDATWMATVQDVFDRAFAVGSAKSSGGLPGNGEPYGWIVGGQLLAAVNPRGERASLTIPADNWNLMFADAGVLPQLTPGKLTLGPFQMALLGVEDIDLGVQEDSFCRDREHLSAVTTGRQATLETESGNLSVLVQQFDESGRLVRKYPGKDPAAVEIKIRASQHGQELSVIREFDKLIWSGISWASARIAATGDGPTRLEIEAMDPDVTKLRVSVARLIPSIAQTRG